MTSSLEYQQREDAIKLVMYMFIGIFVIMSCLICYPFISSHSSYYLSYHSSHTGNGNEEYFLRRGFLFHQQQALRPTE